MHDLIRKYSLATLVTLSADGLNANHIPLHIAAGLSLYGTLKGHVARSNAMWKDFASNVDVLAIFQGPEAYISPSWYATKVDTGKVVPTWNYAVVHAYGRLEIHEDPLWIREQMESLTQEKEGNFHHPWSVSDAPQDFTEKLIGAVVGIEIPITKLLGKWKVSQNQPVQNRHGVIEGLQGMQNNPGYMMADLVKLEGSDAD